MVSLRRPTKMQIPFENAFKTNREQTHCAGCSTKAKLESSRWTSQGQAGPPSCKYCRQRLWMLCGGYLFTKHPRLQHRHWSQPNKQQKTHCKLLWSCVCIGIQLGDLREQPMLHKPAGLKIAQEPSTESNTEATGPLSWQSPFSCTRPLQGFFWFLRL